MKERAKRCISPMCMKMEKWGSGGKEEEKRSTSGYQIIIHLLQLLLDGILSDKPNHDTFHNLLCISLILASIDE